jgi:hypothetical protein
MNIIFRNTNGDFNVINDYINEPKFAVSITANTRGFLPARSYIYAYRLSLNSLQSFEDVCNLKNKCIFLENLIPNVILVPHTKGKDSQFIIDDYILTITSNCIETIHFTHYNWLMTFPKEEIKILISALVNSKITTSLKKVIIDTPNVGLFENILSEVKQS